MSDTSRASPSPSRARTAVPTGNSPRLRSDSSPHHGSSPSRAEATARLAIPIGTPPIGLRTGQATSRDVDSSQGNTEPLAGVSQSSAPGPGASSLSQALRGSFGVPRGSESSSTNPTPLDSARTASPDRRFGAGGGAAGEYGSFTAQSQLGQLGRSPSQSKEDIEVLKRHLVNPSQGGSGVAGSPSGSYRPGNNFPGDESGAQASSGPTVPDEGEFSSLQLQGGDTTRHIYRYAERREREQEERESGRLKRSMSVTLPKGDADDDEISFIQMPGGFRRDHLRRAAGSPAPSDNRIPRPSYGTVNRAYTEPARPRFVTNNFIEFLTLYGHFAGEELEEDDEDLGVDEYFSSDANEEGVTENEDANSEDGGWGEDSALLTPGKRKRRRRPRPAGTGTPFGAAMLLLKSFVGTGVLFLPRAYLNGGMLFSNVVLFGIAVLSYYCFVLLVSVRLKVHASFGDMGGRIFGDYFRNLINFSLVLSQIGFSSAYIVFVAENLQAFIQAVSRCTATINIGWVILMQMIIFLPLSLYRKINHIQSMALLADVFILLGLIYVYFYDIKTIVDQHGIGDIKNFNPQSWTLLIGTAIFTFEGVGLVIPIQSGMAEPAKFPRVMATVMIIVTVVFISAGALSYAAYGSHTKTVILLNMPQDDKMVNAVQFIYSLAILLSTPLQIYPAIEITSQQLFSRTGKYNPWIKWKKNIFRFFMVALCALIAWLGANDLDKFVSLVGSFACIPLVYIYPPLMHYRVVATKTWQRLADILLVIFGVIMMTYTTALTILAWAHGNDAKAPGYCDTGF